MSVIDRLQVDRGVFGGVFGLTDREDLTIGYERVVEEHWLPGSGEEDLTNAERVEIADAVIARWQAWRAKWVEKLASDAKHAARVEEARAAMQARVRTLTATTVAEWLALADWWAAKLAQRAGVTRAVVSRHITGVRPMGELTALKVQRAMREAFDAGNVRVKPLTLEQLCPRLSRRVAPAPATVAIGVFAGFQLVNLPGYR